MRSAIGPGIHSDTACGGEQQHKIQITLVLALRSRTAQCCAS